LRVFELPDGRFRCRRSSTVLDEHDTLEEAVTHLRALAADIGPSLVFFHARAGDVRIIA